MIFETQQDAYKDATTVAELMNEEFCDVGCSATDKWSLESKEIPETTMVAFKKRPVFVPN